jgi:outer membrane protein assembly factor BamB
MTGSAVGASALACAVVIAACGGDSAGKVDRSAPAVTPPVTTPAFVARAIPDGDWPQFNYNAARTGVGPAATGITAGDLGRLRRRSVALPGTVDASVIALHGVKVRGRARDVLVMTTSYGRTLALDARTGKRLWQFVPPDIGSYEGSPQITTATPTADPSRRAVYAAAPDGIVRKLSLASGRPIWSRRVTSDPTHEKLASPPTINGSDVIVVTDGYIGDAPPYQGHVVALDRGAGRVEHVFNTLCSDRRQIIVPRTCDASDSAIFGRAGAVIEPGTNRVLVATGNGPFNGTTNWGDSVLELAPDASALLHNYTPTNQAELNNSDTDLGSTSPAVLPPIGGRRLAIQCGKDGKIRLLDLDRLNGTSGGPSARLGGELQQIDDPGGAALFTQPVVWTHGGRTYVIVADTSGTAAYVLTGGAAQPRLTVTWSDGTPGTSPVIAGGLLYVFDQIGGRLNVLRPATGKSIASFPAATGHWNSPIAVGGRIVLPVGDANDRATRGTLYIYHLPGR